MKALSYDAFVLKIIAVVAMILNHIAIGLQPVLPFGVYAVFFGIGGATYIIMAFFVVEGYRHTSSLKKYIGRLLLFGLIAQAFHPMVLGSTAIISTPIFLNIMFTITLCLLVLLAYDKIKIRFLFWVLFVIACIVSLFMDLSIMAVIGTLLYHTIKEESRRRTLPGVITGIYYLVIGLFGTFSALSVQMQKSAGNYADAASLIAQLGGYQRVDMLWVTPTFAIGAFIGAILIRNFNGERGRRAKWLFYITYPVHLAIIAAIMVLLGITTFNLFGVITF